MQKKKVVIYSTPICPHCITAKQFFKEKNIEFTEYNVMDDEQKLNEMVQKSGQMGVPVIDIGGKIIVGFDRGEIEKALGLKG